MHGVTAFSMDLPCPRHEVNTRQNFHLPTSLNPTSQSTFHPFQYRDARRPRARTRNHRVIAHEWVFVLILLRMGNDCPKGYLGEGLSELSSNRSTYIASFCPSPWRSDFGI